MIGPTAVTLLPDITLALHALNLTTALPSPIYFPSLSSGGEDQAVVVAPTHVSHTLLTHLTLHRLIRCFGFSFPHGAC
jgi:hypothetical protein